MGDNLESEKSKQILNHGLLKYVLVSDQMRLLSEKLFSKLSLFVLLRFMLTLNLGAFICILILKWDFSKLSKSSEKCGPPRAKLN